MLDQPPNADLDSGPRKPAGTERYCAATGAVTPTAEMIRFVLDPDGAVVPDLKRKLPGRGAWVTATREALRRAVARKAFARAFRREVKVGAALVEMTERLLERAILDALSMAHKGRRAVAGFSRVESALADSPVVCLLHASDAAADGVRKLDAALRQRGLAVPVRQIFSSAQLDLALGRPNVIHAALIAGPESDTFLARLARLDRFRGGDSHDGPRAQ